ncbi:hypothetical protein V1509DRAFT_646700 [Lipomyces kononenkoae]
MNTANLYLESPSAYDIFNINPQAPFLALLGDTGNVKDDSSINQSEQAIDEISHGLRVVDKPVGNLNESCQAKGVADAADTHVWFEDLSVALKDIPGLDSWITAYGVSAKAEIREGTLSFRILANDLREEMRRRSKSCKSSNSRIARGTFGPTFPRKGDASARCDVESQGRGRSGKVSHNKRKRQSTEGPTRGANCRACWQLHPLSRCFYVFPEQAESWWRRNEELQKGSIDKALKEDKDLVKEIDKIKKNNSRKEDE